jgi:hypothetical protein
MKPAGSPPDASGTGADDVTLCMMIMYDDVTLCDTGAANLKRPSSASYVPGPFF